MYLITGGAGFIGSNIVSELSAVGIQVAVCDVFGNDGRWKYLRHIQLDDLILPHQLERWLLNNGNKLHGIIHMGAISSTTECDIVKLIENNFSFSKMLWNFCVQNRCSFIYASSAATYGDGSLGFSDDSDINFVKSLKPLNPYGWSKNIFDLWVLHQVKHNDSQPPKWAALKFFNVYGANEQHKGSMKSLVAQNYTEILKGNALKLFKSYNPNFEDGGQMRDFVYVKDCTNIIMWLLENKFKSDIYNVGSGLPKSWLDLASAMFSSIQKPVNVEFIEIPDHIKDQYQYFTQADISKLRSQGFAKEVWSLERGVDDYIKNYLAVDEYSR